MDSEICTEHTNNKTDKKTRWYIYKPPGESLDFTAHGSNFSFISSEQAGRWQASERPLTSHSMLQNTLAPLYRVTYTDHMAYIIYEDWHLGNSWLGSAMKGILMADKLGGVWMLHTISNFPDTNKRSPVIPEQESAFGHLIVCFSLDLATINEIVKTMKPASPKIKSFRIPPKLESYLTSWKIMNKPMRRSKQQSRNTNVELFTRDKTLRLAIRVRRPGDPHCLCHSFAQDKQIVLDVYGEEQRNLRICKEEYSVRNIERISVKLKESVAYVPKNATDRAQFAVSTAAHWQKRGHNSNQYWTCVGSLSKGNTTSQAGVMVCVDSFQVWLTFDNLKVKEPEC